LDFFKSLTIKRITRTKGRRKINPKTDKQPFIFLMTTLLRLLP